MIEENSQDHPAVTAWLELNAANRRPTAVIALYAAKSARKKNKKKPHSAVYKLEGTNKLGRAIVAKWSDKKTARLECVVYESFLTKLPVSSLEYYGSVEIDGAHWLFLEYAAGIEWRLENMRHLELAINWLATLHCSSAKLDSISQLPDKGPRYYRSQLEKARWRIVKAYLNPGLRSSDIEILNRFVEHTDLLEPRWPEIENFCRAMPVSLVHNDFVKKNIHVRSTQNSLVLLPFDWEMSGQGVPAVDLNWMFSKAPEFAITRYTEQARKIGADIGQTDIQYMAAIGAVFRVLDAIEWSSYDFLMNYPRKSIPHVENYARRLIKAYEFLGWS